MTLSPAEDARFTEPIYGLAEAAFFLRVPASTLDTWVRGYIRRPPGRGEVRGEALITAVPAQRGWPRIPFIGLAEAHVLTAFRRAGVSLQHIRRALEILKGETADPHILASRRLYADGQRILYDYRGEGLEVVAALTEVVSGQHVFKEVIRRYLERIEYDETGWALKLFLPIADRPIVVADPARAFGKPLFVHGGTRVKDVLDRWRAGDSLAEVSLDFAVPQQDVEDVLRAAIPEAA